MNGKKTMRERENGRKKHTSLPSSSSGHPSSQIVHHLFAKSPTPPKLVAPHHHIRYDSPKKTPKHKLIPPIRKHPNIQTKHILLETNQTQIRFVPYLLQTQQPNQKKTHDTFNAPRAAGMREKEVLSVHNCVAAVLCFSRGTIVIKSHESRSTEPNTNTTTVYNNI